MRRHLRLHEDLIRFEGRVARRELHVGALNRG
jgi:hypothetical protein